MVVQEQSTLDLIEELWERGHLGIAAKEYRHRTPWFRRLRLGPHVWGLSSSWFAFCPWNGDTAWVTLPFVYFGAGTKNIELGLGHGKWHVTFDIRWRWD